MIKITDAALLAYTKLRSRKTRLIVTVVISSLLFGVLVFSSFLIRGISSSVSSFAQDGFGKRYILTADRYTVDGAATANDPAVQERAIALQKEQIVRKKTEAKRLGIEYDQVTERLVYYEGEGPSGKGKYLDFTHPLAQQAIKEKTANAPSVGASHLKNVAEPYGATNYFEMRYLSFGGENSGQLKILKDGKENYQLSQNQPGNPFTRGLESFDEKWSLMSGELLKDFTLNNTTGVNVKEGYIPIVAPYSAVEQLLQLSPLPSTSSPKDRLARIKEVRSKAGTLEFASCYRNSTSAELISTAVSQQAEAEQNKNNKDYQKPSLVYDLPTEPCTPARVVRDVRTEDEKKLAAKQEEFALIFGKEPAKQVIYKFVVIGVSPDPPGMSTAAVDGIISSIVGSYVGEGWYTPLEVIEKDPTLALLFPQDQLLGRPISRYVELPTANAARSMLKEKNCQPDFEAFMSEQGPSGGQASGDPYEKCAEQGTPFVLSPFGSNSIAMDDLQRGFRKVLIIAAMVVVAIAGLIMMGTIGRIISDARRETAVFRAIGAKRLDIAQIYITYVLVVSILIVVVSILVGFGISQYFQSQFGTRVTVNALLAYNSRDLSRQFLLYAWNNSDMLLIAVSVVSAGLIGSILPLFRNLRRNPIRDMRDDG